MVGGDLRLCWGSNEDCPESSQDFLSLGWCILRTKARHLTGRALSLMSPFYTVLCMTSLMSCTTQQKDKYADKRYLSVSLTHYITAWHTKTDVLNHSFLTQHCIDTECTWIIYFFLSSLPLARDCMPYLQGQADLWDTCLFFHDLFDCILSYRALQLPKP